MIEDNLYFSRKNKWINFIEYADNPDNPKLPSDQLTSCLQYHCILLLLLIIIIIPNYYYYTQNMLSNAEKTEVILFTSRFTKTPNIEKLFFDSTVIELTEKVRDLGVILDKNLTPTYHINETCRKATNAIRSIGRIRKYLTNKNLKLLVNALVISRLDYCNSILYGLPKRQLEKLQRVQNTAARLITWN